VAFHVERPVRMPRGVSARATGAGDKPSCRSHLLAARSASGAGVTPRVVAVPGHRSTPGSIRPMITPSLTDRQQAALERFAGLVASSPHNLVSRRARAELLTRHVPECVALAGLLPAGAGRLLDVGSGGGFPGIVIAVTRPELEVHLLDSTTKKTDFLLEVAATLELDNVLVHTGRAELLAKGELGHSFDLVTARAVASLDRLLAWTVPYLSPDGVLYAVKGARWREELDQATDALRRTGARVLATPDDLPRLDDVRSEVRPRVVMIGRLR
jgi:16S rRNA (guanine527-N7)-methyltransferase